MSVRELSNLWLFLRHPGWGKGEKGDENLVAESAAADDRMLGLICGGYCDYLVEEKYALPVLLSSDLYVVMVLPRAILGGECE